MINKKSIIALSFLFLLFCFTACSSEADESFDEDGNEIPISSNDQAEKLMTTIEKEEFLPKEVISSLKDELYEIGSSKEKDSDKESIFYIWNTYDEDAENPEETDIHNIQMTEQDGELTSYHYKNYSFDMPLLDTPMSKDDALEMVKRFAAAFIPDGDSLTFKNDPKQQVQSVYDPGHVETWTATSGGKTYHVVVDLDMGGVIYFAR